MSLAVDLSEKSVAEDDRTDTPRVGVVVAKDGEILAQTYRGMDESGGHAEFCALRDLEGVDLQGAVVYSTLEPCSRRGIGKVPCAERLVAAGVAVVFVGVYDPNPRIYREGWRILRDGGVEVRDFSDDIRTRIEIVNEDFIGQFRHGIGIEGTASFDHLQNNGEFEIWSEAGGTCFTTRWTGAGAHNIYAYRTQDGVAHARYVNEFAELDNPGVLDFAGHYAAVAEGEVCVFKNSAGYALVRVEEVQAGHPHSDHTSLKISWELLLREG